MEDPSPSTPPIGVAGWITIVVLAGLLLAALAYAIHAWSRMEGATISGFGWAMMGLGVFFTLACGIGLMGLVFYSSRKNFDQ
jgi:hypothetical protein